MNQSVLIIKLIEKIKSIGDKKSSKFIEIMQKKEASQKLENTRHAIAQLYLKGEGVEIGALNNPLNLPKSASVKYLDKYSIEELRKHNISFDFENCVKVDIFDDGERLESLKDASLDFVISNHFIEHCENPLKSIENMIRIIKSNGILFLSIPDKRFTFDKDRPVTPLEHILKDYYEGPIHSKRAHYEEWVKYLGNSANLSNKHFDNFMDEVNYLMKIDYSIHYHVWTQTEILEYVLFLKKLFDNFEIEIFLKNISEIVVVLKKY